jgi:peptidoglycan/LPS O-acetylase OafA/YrhL
MGFLPTLSIVFAINLLNGFLLNGFWLMKKRPVKAKSVVALTIDSLVVALVFALVMCSKQVFPRGPDWIVWVAAFLCLFLYGALRDWIARSKT